LVPEEEFNQIREGFEPADYHEYLKEYIASEVAEQQPSSSSNNGYGSAYEECSIQYLMN
jgi:hypothetical protein